MISQALARLYKWIPCGLSTVVVVGLIAYLSLDADPIGTSRVHLFRGADKVVHVIMYFVLSVVAVLDCAKPRLPHHLSLSVELAAVASAALFGVLMEICQGLMNQGRGMDYHDMIANAAGALLALGLLRWRLMHLFRRAVVPLYLHCHNRRRHRD